VPRQPALSCSSGGNPSIGTLEAAAAQPLSHAINLDLLRLGLTRSFAADHLFDAVLAGQVEGDACPSQNLLAAVACPLALTAFWPANWRRSGLLLRSA